MSTNKMKRKDEQNGRQRIQPQPRIPPVSVRLTFMQKKTASVSLHHRFFHGRGWITQAALMIRNPGCGSQRLLLCRSHPAGRGPSLASLFPPQAAVGSAAVRIHPPSPEKISAKQKIQYPVRILDFLVGAGGLRKPRC